MSDGHDDAAPDPAPEPEQDAQIRALLAELGSGPDGEPMPPEVAARLEDTLALLVAERGREGMTTGSSEESAGNVVPMRRRWLPRLAGAAAAVIVLGAGGVAAANLGLLGGTNQARSDQGASSGAGDSKAESAPGSSAPAAGDDSSQALADGAAVSLPQLSATNFATDTKRLLLGRSSSPAAGPQDTAPSDTQANERKGEARLLDSCPGPKTTGGAVSRPVRYDGDLAVLVVHPERDGQRLVEAWDCAGTQRLARTTLTQ
jgi:hypothetical protein